MFAKHVLHVHDTYCLFALDNFNQHLSIQGFREDVFEASQLIDKLVENSAAQTPTLQVFQVRTNQVSAIVGRNGTTVRTIEKQSGARVIVVKRNTSSNDLFTSIKVSGTALQIKEAYRLIDLYLTRERRNTQFKYVDDEDDSDFESFIDLSLISSPPCSSSSANFNKRINLSQLGQLTETLEASSKSDALSLPCKVFVSHIVSPIEFYVIINDSRGRKFDKLQCDMVEFFSVSQNRKLCQCHHSEADLSGQIVAVCRRVELTSDFNYFRGFVTKVMAENQLQVYLVDLGQTEVLPCDQLFYLNDTFVQMLPFQAIKCSLENFGSQSTWNDLQMDRFRQLTREGLWEDVGLRCFGKNGQTHVVELFRELRNETINIGVELVAS